MAVGVDPALRRYLILFPSTYDALRAERNWPQSGFAGKLRPIPRVLSSSCGLCLQTDLPEGEDPVQVAQNCNVVWEQIVTPQEKGYVIVATKE